MTTERDDKNLLYKISVDYYNECLTQKQIGKRYGISRIKVSRLLNLARKLRIVQITINPAERSTAASEHLVGAHFGVDEVLAATPQVYTHQALLDAIGVLGAETLIRSIQGKEVVAITWGNTLDVVINSLPVANNPDLRIVQSLGGLSRPDASIYGPELVRRMAETMGARPILLSSPGLVANSSVRDMLLEDRQIATTLRLASQADIAMVGIGALNQDSPILQNDLLSESDIRRLKAKGVVGDIGFRFFNQNGEIIEDEINDRVVGLRLDQYKRIRRVIGVSGGEDKFEAVRAALHGKLIDVLVTDNRILSSLLAELKPAGEQS